MRRGRRQGSAEVGKQRPGSVLVGLGRWAVVAVAVAVVQRAQTTEGQSVAAFCEVSYQGSQL